MKRNRVVARRHRPMIAEKLNISIENEIAAGHHGLNLINDKTDLMTTMVIRNNLMTITGNHMTQKEKQKKLKR